MGDRLTEEQQSRQTSPTPYGDTFDEFLPHYLAMGMTYDEFWDGEYGTKHACRKAYQIRIENEQRLADRNNWYMGQYMLSVFQAMPLLVAGLNVKNMSNLPKYPEKPFFDQFEERKKEETRKQKEEDQMKLAMAMFQAGIAKFNKRFQQEEKPKAVESGQ